MKDVVAAVIAWLKADTALCSSSYVGATPNQRIYRASFPQTPTFPLLTVTLVDTMRKPPHTGTRIGESRVQCSAFALSDVTASTISDLVADRMARGENQHLGVNVFGIKIDDGGARADSDPTIGKYIVHRDFLIRHFY